MKFCDRKIRASEVVEKCMEIDSGNSELLLIDDFEDVISEVGAALS